MSSQLILVTGATGKTGAHVVEQLIERGLTVRALARVHDERSERLAALGAPSLTADTPKSGALIGTPRSISTVAPGPT